MSGSLSTLRPSFRTPALYSYLDDVLFEESKEKIACILLARRSQLNKAKQTQDGLKDGFVFHKAKSELNSPIGVSGLSCNSSC